MTSRSEPGPFVQIQVSRQASTELDTLYALDQQGEVWVAYQRRPDDAHRTWPFTAWEMLDVDEPPAIPEPQPESEDDIPF